METNLKIIRIKKEFECLYSIPKIFWAYIYKSDECHIWFKQLYYDNAGIPMYTSERASILDIDIFEPTIDNILALLNEKGQNQ